MQMVWHYDKVVKPEFPGRYVRAKHVDHQRGLPFRLQHGAVEIESHRAGEPIFSQGARAVERLRVVRRGAVEIVADGRVLDLLGEGEMFGHASMLSGYPTEFEARAAEEDTQCYRISAPVAERLLSGPEGLRY